MNHGRITKFFMKGQDEILFCSHCGSMVLQDHYQMVQHGKKCGFTSGDICEILTSSSFFYLLEKEDDQTLALRIVKPELVMNPRSGRYAGGEWKTVYQALFSPNSREIKEDGLYNLNLWLGLIDIQKVSYLGEEPIQNIIASVFPTVPFTYSLLMFCHLYQMKGFKTVSFQPSKEQITTYCTERKEERSEFEGCLDFVNCNRYEGSNENIGIYGELVKDKTEHPFLAIRCYCAHYKKYYRDFGSFLIGDGFLYTSELFDFDCAMDLQKNRNTSIPFTLWTSDFTCWIAKEDLDEFDRIYPSFGLHNYISGGGKNILIPLLCGNYHKGIELLAKGGYSEYADLYFSNKLPKRSLFQKEPYPMDYRNAPTLMNLPKIILKNNAATLFSEEKVRKRLTYIYQQDRSLVEGLSLNPLVLKFLCEQDVLHDHSVRSYIRGIRQIPKPAMRQILVYLSHLQTREEYTLYLDYLDMLYQTGVQSFGYCPKNLVLAHNDLMRSLKIKQEQMKEERFLHAIDQYRNLATKEKNEEPAPKYLIRVPYSIEDVYQEGRNQSNCVATYIDRIISGHSKILFMRHTNNQGKSLVTIEVAGKRLIQAKAAFNCQATPDCQRFICDWCNTNEISYRKCSDITIQ